MVAGHTSTACSGPFMGSHIDWSIMPLQLCIWSFVCLVSAAPSLLIGASLFENPEQIAGMATGIAIFIAMYTLAACTEWAKQARQDRVIRRTLQIGYATRIVLSIIVPISIFIDGLLGAASVNLSGALFGPAPFRGYPHQLGGASYSVVVFTTLVQGILLNLLLLVYMAIIYSIVKRVMTKRWPDHICPTCGYDVRASGDVCSECGTPIRNGLVRVSA